MSDPEDPRPPQRPKPRRPATNPASRLPGPEDRTTEPDLDEDAGASTFRPAEKPVKRASGASKSTGERTKPKTLSVEEKPGLFERVIFGRVSAGQLSVFCRQFAAYQDAGVALVRSLDNLQSQFARTALGPILGRVSVAVRKGDTLSDAFARERAFDGQFLAMMRVAESRGGVPETLRLLATQYEARQKLVRQARSAMVYPVAVLVMASAVSALLVFFVLPIFLSALNEFGSSLPMPTRVLIWVTTFARAVGWWAIPLGAVVGVYLLTRAYRTASGKRILDELSLWVPVLGTLLRKIDTARFARVLSGMLEAGVDVGYSLDLTADCLRLDPMRRSVREARREVMEGNELSATLQGSRRWYPDVIAVIESGEETGKLPESLERVADDYEEQVEYMVKNLGSLIQPLLMIALGVLVGFIILAFILPYIAAITSMSRM